MARVESNGKWRPAKHLLLLNHYLLQVASGKIKRLMITMPPRHGKSELASKYLPAWYIGMFPDKRIISASFDADLSAEFSGKARAIIEEYGPEVFGIEINKRSNANDRWNIAGRNGGMFATSVGGRATGRGADLFLIDDPVKNAEDALSQRKREKNKDWFDSTAYTRLMPDASMIIIQTRWHDDDLAGMLLKDKFDDPDEAFVQVNLPAIATENDILGREVGEALWPSQYPLKRLNTIRQRIKDRWFDSLYQQKPGFAEGDMFKRAWFGTPVKDWPKEAHLIRYWDFAATKKEAGGDPDWTVGALVAYQDGMYWLVHMVRTQGNPKEVEDLVRQTAKLDGREVQIIMEQEPGASGVNVIDHYVRKVLVGYSVKRSKTSGSKVARAFPFSSTAEHGNIKICEGDWNGIFLDEADAFPFGSHDDMVDAFVGACEGHISGFIDVGAEDGEGYEKEPDQLLDESPDEQADRLMHDPAAWDDVDDF